MKPLLSFAPLALALLPGIVSAAVPVVSNVVASQRTGTKLVDITYNVADADGDSLKIRVEVSDNAGTTYAVPAFALTGAVGDNIAPGTGKTIVWNAGVDWDGEYSEQMRVKVIATDSKGFPGLEWGNEVPPGGFLMGQDGGAEGSGPSRHVNIPWSFWMSKYEIRNDEYCEFLNTAIATGRITQDTTSVKSVLGFWTGIGSNLELLQIGDAKDIRWNVNKFEVASNRTNFPVTVTWYGALAFAQQYGYDLPTDAEWEKAARGPLYDDQGEHTSFPWGNAFSNAYGNFAGSGDPFEITFSGYGKTPVGYYNGNQTPLGPDTKNGYGLYDLIGNVDEWTRSTLVALDTYNQEESLAAPQHSLTSSTTTRVVRGGHSKMSSTSSINFRTYNRNPGIRTYYDITGFRVVRRSTP
jgi:formylglycine-generating enzyme required for sulfatase activity